jgi:hypothetical protein
MEKGDLDILAHFRLEQSKSYWPAVGAGKQFQVVADVTNSPESPDSFFVQYTTKYDNQQ